MRDAADSEVLADPQAQFARWQMPVFESASNDAPLTAQAIEDIEAAAYEEGRQRGYADGLKTGREDMNQQVARLRGLIEQIARPLATLDDEVERALVDLACAVARRLLDEELTLAPERVLTLARTALAALPADLRDIRLYLHPDDARQARDELLPPPEAENFRIFDDPALARGDCRVQTESAYLDARLDARIALAAAALNEASS
ncbi:MAG TPA: FliH/SctL family protein [Solimonas sp.]